MMQVRVQLFLKRSPLLDKKQSIRRIQKEICQNLYVVRRTSLRLNHSHAFSQVFVHPTAKIGQNTQIHPFTYIGEGVIIGNDCEIQSNVSIANTIIGNYVKLHSGVRIGQDGFGFMLSDTGHHTKKPQELLVQIHDHVEIGANTTIDRGSWRNTVIGQGCKLDNLIQVGHNVQLGSNCIIAAQTGIAGSVTIGKNTHIGGQVGIAQHLNIGDNVRIAAKSGVMHDLQANQTYGGLPAVPIMNFRRLLWELRRLSQKNK